MTNGYDKQAQTINKVNAFRTLKTTAILNIMRALDNATTRKKNVIDTRNYAYEKQNFVKYDLQKIHHKELDQLANNLNSYRVSKLLKTLLDCQIDKTKLLEFKKTDEHIYTLDTSQVLQIADSHLEKIKRMIVLEYHNLKVFRFRNLNGLLHNVKFDYQIYLSATLRDIEHDTNIFSLHEETYQNKKIWVGLMDKN